MNREIKGYSSEESFQYPSDMPYAEIFGKYEPEFKYYFVILHSDEGNICFLRNKETNEKSLIPSCLIEGIDVLKKRRILEVLSGPQYLSEGSFLIKNNRWN